MKKRWIKLFAFAAGAALSASFFAACNVQEEPPRENGVVRAFRAVNPEGELISQTAAADGEKYLVTVVTSDAVSEYSLNAQFEVERENEVAGKKADAASLAESVALSDLERAFKEALRLSGIEKQAVEGFDFDRDTYMGKSVFKVEIEDAAAEYSYVLDAADLSVLSAKTELKTSARPGGTSYIGEEKAKQIALGAVEIGESEAENFALRSVLEDGRRVYKANFDYDGFRYTVDIDAMSGEIVKLSKTVLGGNATLPEIPSIISEEAAKQIALSFVYPDGAEGKNVVFRKVKLDYEKGQFTYEVEFYAEGNEYELEISAKDGTILDAEIDGGAKGGLPSAENFLTREEAVAKVLEVAGADALVLEVDIEKEYVNGELRYFYEIEVKANGKKAEYYVDAVTGSVTRNEEYMGDPADPAPALTEAQALQIALDEFKLTEQQLTYQKIKLEREAGRLCYEIKLYVGGSEYKMSIDAQTGAILEREIDLEHAEQLPQPPASEYITEAQARAAVTEYFAAKGKTARITEVEWEDEGTGAGKRYYYEVEAIVDGREYECYVDAVTGDVRVKGELIDSSKELIGEERALAIALDRYTLTKGEVRDIEIKLEEEDGYLIYEVEFEAGPYEYAFEIDAYTGVILKADVSFD